MSTLLYKRPRLSMEEVLLELENEDDQDTFFSTVS